MLQHVCGESTPNSARRFRAPWRTVLLGRGGDSRGWHHHDVVFVFLAWLAVGIAMWRGYRRVAMLGAVGSMILTLALLKVHATDVIGLCL